MPIVPRNSQYVPAASRQVAYDDFDLHCRIRLPDAASRPVGRFFLISLRIKTPLVISAENNYINPLGNFGGKQYFLAFEAGGRVVLQKTENRHPEKFWREIVNEDGRTLAVPQGWPYILGEAQFDPSAEELAVQISVRGGRFRVELNGRPALDVVDSAYYPGGFVSFTAVDCDLELLDAEIRPVPAAPLRLIEVRPTGLFLQGRPLRQLARVQIENSSDAPLCAFVKITLADQSAVESLGLLPPGHQEVDLPVPDVENPARLRLELFAEGAAQPADSREREWPRQRKRTIWLFTSSHEDLGYCGHINKLKEEMAQYLELACDLCDATADRPAGERYQYLVEHMWWLLGYAELRGAADLQALVEKYVRPGRIEPMFIHSGTHTHWNQPEQLARSAYYGRREARDRFGLDPVTAIYADTPGVAWPAAQVFAQAGAKYLLNARGPWRYERKPGAPDQFYANAQNTFPYYEPEPSGLTGPFFWEGPNGRDRLLIQSLWSYGGDRIFNFTMHKGYGEFAAYIEKYLAEQQDYPWDDMLEPCYTDHEIPNLSAVDLIARWNTKFAFPRLRLCNLTEYFEHLAQNYADRLPVRRGDLPDNWADYAAIDPAAFGVKRALANELPGLEMLACRARLLDPAQPYPYREIYDLWWRLMEFDEHCWATMLPPTPENVFNHDLTKKGNLAWACRRADDLKTRLLEALSAGLPGAGPRIVLWNPLARARDEVIELDVADFPFAAFRLLDDISGEELPFQFIDAQTIICLVRDLPPGGARTIRIEAAVQSVPPPVQAEVEQVTTVHYELAFAAGRLVRLYSRALKRDLLDATAPYAFNQFLYVHTEHYNSPELTVHPAAVARLAVETGPVATVVRTWGTEPESGARLEQSLIFYHHSPRIDVANRQTEVRKLLYEGCLGQHYGDVGNRYLDNFFYAFPLRVENFKFEVELAGGVARVPEDFLPVGVRDFYAAQNWVEVGNGEFGVALYCREAPILHLGEIRYNHFARDYLPAHSHFYSYAASNRMAGLHTRSLADCDLTFHYSLLPHAGTWREADVAGWSQELACPVLCRFDPTGGSESSAAEMATGLEIEPANVHIGAFKHSEKPGGGYVLRLRETQGQAGEALVRLPFLEIGAAWSASLVEDPQTELALESPQALKFEISAFDWRTILIQARGRPLGQAVRLRAVALGDNYVRLTWEREGDSEGWCIFRGEKADFAPTQYNLVGFTAGTEFAESGLLMGTTYHYRVMAVDRWNNGGKPSPALTVTTSTENISPPAPLEEVRVATIDRETLSLIWKTSREKDVAFYEIHRAEKADLTDQVKIALVPAEPFYIHHYYDHGLSSDTGYLYTVTMVDLAGNRSPHSMPATGRTSADDWWQVRSYADKYRAADGTTGGSVPAE